MRTEQAEPCDWCGRPGTVRQYDYWSGRTLVCRDPALCDFCALVWNAPGNAIDAFIAAGLDYDDVMRAFEAELERKWKVKVEAGVRKPPGKDDGPREFNFVEWRHRRPVPRRQLWMRSEVGAESPFWDVEGHMVGMETLPLSADLRERLADWTDVAWASEDEDLRCLGLTLLDEVVAQVGREFRIIWDDD